MGYIVGAVVVEDRIAGHYGGYIVMEQSICNSVSAQHRLQRTAAPPLGNGRVLPEMRDNLGRSLASPAATAEPNRWAS